MKTPLSLLLALLIPALSAAEMSLLNGHLSITLPDEAIYGERSTSLMGPGPGDDETLIWIGEGDDRVAVYAEELGVLAADNFAERQKKNMQEQLGSKGFECGELPGIVYALATKAPENPSGQDFLAVADLRHTDGTVQRLSFYFARNRAKDIAACRELALKAIKSLKPGDRKLPLHARDELITPVSLTPEDAEGNFLILPLPEGCHAIHTQGADFLHNIYSIIRKQGERSGRLRVYVGHHPSTEAPQAWRKGTMLGREEDWGIDTYASDGRYCADCLVLLCGDEEFGLYAHFLITAYSEEERDALIRWAESARIGKPKGSDAP